MAYLAAPLVRRVSLPMHSLGTEATTTIDFIAPFTGRLTGANVVPAVAEAASDTNKHVMTIVNKGAAGSGTTEMAAASTAATGGTAFTAHVENPFTLDSTVADRAFTEGDVISILDTIGGTTTENILVFELDLTRDA
jgi:hypothetical protein